MAGVSIYSRIEAYHAPVHVPLERYINSKMDMLERDFLIKLDDYQIKRLKQSKSEYEVDRVARKIIFDRYDD